VRFWACAGSATLTVAAGLLQAQSTQPRFSLPPTFEENRGQAQSTVRFLSKGARGEVYLSSSALTLAMPGGPVEIRFRNASLTARLEPEGPIRGISNYFLGRDKSRWRTAVPRYAAVRYRELYPGIDAVFYGRGNDIEFDFLIAPGANPSLIAIEFLNGQRLHLTPDGDLIVETAAGAFCQHKPAAFQEIAGKRKEVTVSYHITGQSEVTFSLGPYVQSLPLTIDPVLSFSTYLGGTGAEGIVATAVDPQGYLYVTGTTTSTNFPVSSGAVRAANSGAQDIFVAKLTPDGSQLIYATYLGGSGNDTAAGIAADGLGNAYVVGISTSPNFPTTAGAYRTAPTGIFVAKLSPAGTQLLYSTTLDTGIPKAIAVDAGGNAYVCGSTSSAAFPVTPGALQTTKRLNQDAFVTKLNSSGSGLVYSTLLGGDGDEQANAIAVDSLGYAYVAGTVEITGANFPITAGALRQVYQSGEAFLAKLNPSASALVFATFLGGSGWDGATAIALDSQNAIYVAGNTRSSDFPTTPKAFQTSFESGPSGFVTKLEPSGRTLLYSTLLAPYACCDGVTVTALGVNAMGQAHVAGYTTSIAFPVTSDALQLFNGGLTDGFLTKLDAAGEIVLYSTLLGGRADDYAFALAIDALGNAFVAGQTFSENFPVTQGAVQPVSTGAGDAFAAFLSMSAGSCTFSLSETSRSFTAAGGSGTVTVIAPAGCRWVASSSDRWVMIVSGASGAGTGTVTYSVGPNNNTLARSARLTIAGVTYTVIQAGAPCTYTLQPASRSFSTDGGLSTFNVIAPTGCLWTAYSTAAWITLFITGSPPAGGTGTVTFSVEKNTGLARTGSIIAAGQSFAVVQSAAPGVLPRATKIGAFYAGSWLLDLNGNFTWDGVSTDRAVYFSSGSAADRAVLGDWNGSGTEKIGVYSDGIWVLDYNGNGLWDGPSVDKVVYFGGPGWIPVTGDWNGDGRTKIGAYKDGVWMLDYDGNYAWNPPADRMPFWGGTGFEPVVGDWSKTGFTKIGVYREGQWLLDYNGDFLWNSAIDKNVYFGGPGYRPVIGDWNGSGNTKIGAYKDGEWLLDYNGNLLWDGPSLDKAVFFGGPGWLPVVGDWNAGGSSKIGAYKDGSWLLDYNGSFTWDPPSDKAAFFGGPGQTPVAGKW